MNVELINIDEAKNVWKTWSEVASVCYDSKVKNPEIIGKHCFLSGHFSGSRGVYFIFKITDCPRFVIDQLVRHETGVFKNVQSFRYVNTIDIMNCNELQEIITKKDSFYYTTSLTLSSIF